MRNTIRGVCEICGEPIPLEDAYYVMPGGELICEDCLQDWAEPYHRLGEYDLGFDEEGRAYG